MLLYICSDKHYTNYERLGFFIMNKVQLVEAVAAAGKLTKKDAEVAVKAFYIFEKGEGIEKREDDFAAEIEKMVKG